MASQQPVPNQAVLDFLAKNKASTTGFKPVDLRSADATQYSAIKDRDASDQDFLSWLIDIASRPLFAGTETVSSIIDAADPQSAMDLGQRVGHVVSAPFRGFFSTNPEDKIYTGELIEKATDVVGKNTNPAYKDTQNNVDPLLKGALGFVGDVAADPLTYIGLGTLRNAGQAVKAGAKAAAPVVAGATRAATRAVKKTVGKIRKADDVVDIEPLAKTIADADTEVLVTDTIQQSAAKGAPAPEVPEPTPAPTPAPKPLSAREQKIADAEAAEAERVAKFTEKYADAPLRAVINATRTAGGKKKLTEQIREMQAPQSYAEYGDLVDETPRSFEDFQRTIVQTARQFEEPVIVKVTQAVEKADGSGMTKTSAEVNVTELAEKADKILRRKPSKQLKDAQAALAKAESQLALFQRNADNFAKTYGDTPLSELPPAQQADIRNINSLISQGQTLIEKQKALIDSLTLSKSPEYQRIMSDLEAVYEKYLDAFKAETLGENKVVSIFGDIISVDKSTKVTTALGNYQVLYRYQRDFVEALFGKNLANNLRKLGPEQFEKSLDDFLGVLDKDGLIDELVASPTSSMVGDKQRRLIQFIERVGVDYESFRQLQAQASVRATVSPNTAATTPAEAAADFIGDVDLNSIKSDYGFGSVADAAFGIDIAKKAIAEVFTKDVAVKLGGRYKFTSKTGVLQSSDDFGIGIARDLSRANTFFQFDIYKAVNEPIFDYLLNDVKLQGKELIAARYSLGKATIELVEDFFRQNGFNLHIDNPLGPERFLLSTSDVFEVVATTPKNRFAVSAAFFNAAGDVVKTTAGTGSPITKYMDALAVALAGGDRAAVRKMLTSTTQRNKAKLTAAEAKQARAKVNAADPGAGGQEKIDNFLSKKKAVGVAGRLPKAKEDTKLSIEGAIVTNKQGKMYIGYEADTLADILTDSIMDNLDELSALAEANLKAAPIKVKADATVIAKKTITDILKNFGQPEDLGRGILAVAARKNAVVDNAVKVGASPTAHAAAEVITDNAIGPVAQQTAKSLVKKAEAAAEEIKGGKGVSAATKKKRDEANIEAAEAGQKLVDDNLQNLKNAADNGELPPAAADEVYEEFNRQGPDKITSDTFAGIKGTIVNLMSPFRKMFIANTGQVNGELDTFEITRNAGNIARDMLQERTREYRQIARDYGGFVDEARTTTEMQQAFINIQKKASANGNARVEEAMKRLQPVLATLFDFSNTGDTAVLNTAFMRNNPAGLELLNKTLKEFDILRPKGGYKSKQAQDFADAGTDFFDIGRAIDEKKRQKKLGNDIDLLSAAMDQWREWPVDDVLDFLSKADAVVLRLTADTAAVGSLLKTGLKHGFIVTTPQEGFTKLVFDGKTRFGPLLQGEYYFDKETAEVIYTMDRVMQETTDLGKVITQFYDPTLQAWQFSITQLRPGHHARNLIGNFSMQYLAEGFKGMIPARRMAAEALTLMGRTEDVDMLRLLNNLGEPVAPKPGKVISKGNYGDLTHETIVENFLARGMRRTARVIDDIWETEGFLGKFGNAIRRLSAQDTIVADKAGKLSEWNDNWSRLSHMYQIIEKEQKAKVKRFKTFDELMDYAQKRVQRFHPDPTTLTTFERKYMRRIIPFYSWTRGAIPALIEASLYNPGRVTVFNKASYNLAVAMGVNPDSLYDPFPEDQLFPSFLTDKVQGPQFKIGGKYYSVSPGFVSWDLPNTYMSDPFRGALGSTSPLIRLPLELITGTSLGTGAKIRDYSDYVDSNIPGINYLASVSGYSPTGSIASMLQGMGLDPMYQVSAGNRTGTSAALSAVNWLTGFGISEYSRPNYINFAEIEKRNREAVNTRSGY